MYSFETSRMDATARYMVQHKLHANVMTLDATGGGAHKVKDIQ